MSDNDNIPADAPARPSVADGNVERLISRAYRPERIDADFARLARQRVLDAAAANSASSERQETAMSTRTVRLVRGPSPLFGPLGAIAAVLLVGLGVFALLRPRPVLVTGPVRPAGTGPSQERAGGSDTAPVRLASYDGRLTPAPRPATPTTRPAAAGDSIQTKKGERRRVTLVDGSVLYVNENTSVKVEGPRRVTLSAGEVFVEVSPRDHGSAADPTFVVKTPGREVSALGTKFDVRVDPKGTSVLVTQGKVKLSDWELPVEAGQQAGPEYRDYPKVGDPAVGPPMIAPAPRASHTLAWTRELIAASETPLVPDSPHEGGALIVVNPNGQEMKLSLRKYHVDVHVEDGFARTTIDQTYFNHENRRNEGTFYFPLPADAQLSRLAMYVGENLMEGGMAEREYAREVYESIVYTQKDPALLEWVDGSTFKMRVFPLEPREEKRIILSYTQRVPEVYARADYRFPAGHTMPVVNDWSFHARIKGGARPESMVNWESPSHVLVAKPTPEGDLLLDAGDKFVKPDRDVVLRLYSPSKASAGAGSDARWSSAAHEGSKYLMLRYRPSLPGAPKKERRDWVFLFESSGNRDPLLARAQIDVIRTVLANAEHDDTFSIITAAARADLLTEKPLPATPQNVAAAVAKLDKTHLVGALDLANALAAAAPLLKGGEGRNPHLVHVGTGVAAMGERREDVLAKSVPENARYVGVGVGKRWSRPFMKAAAARTGGYFTQINPDEPVAWRAFELVSTLNTPRLLDVKVTDDAGKATFLSFDDSLAQGDELCAVTRVGGDAPLPKSVTVTGKVNGQAFSQTVGVAADAGGDAAYLPRVWAKLEIDRLLAENMEANKSKVIELSKAMYVMSPFTSLLVLENEQMYQQFKVDRGRKDHWALYPAPAKIQVVHEPLVAPAPAPQPATKPAEAKPATPAKPSEQQVLNTILVRVPVQAIYWPNRRDRDYRGQSVSVGQMLLPVVTVPDGGTLMLGGQVLDTNWYAYPHFAGSPNFFMDNFAASNMDLGSVQRLRLNEWGFQNGNMWRDGVTAGDRFVIPRLERLSDLDEGSGNGLVRRGWGRLNRSSSGVTSFTADAKRLGGFDMRGIISRDRLPGGFGGARAGLKQKLAERPAVLYKELAGESMLRRESLLELAFKSRSIDDDFLPMSGPGVSSGGRRPMPFGTVTNGAVRLPALSEARQKLSQVNRSLRASGRGLDLAARGRWDSEALVAADVGFDFDINTVARRVLDVSVWSALTYQRPSFNNDHRVFGDLLAYAPGMNTTTADVLAVLEAEAAVDPSDAPSAGKIDPAAKALVDAARSGGWRRVTLPAAGDEPGAEKLTITFDGTGRYAYERTVGEGLVEKVVCDGETLWHLYPEIGVGSKRTVSRFHRAQFAAAVPWALPPVEDLARGADLVMLGDRTVALVPHGAEEWLKAAATRPATQPATQPAGYLRTHLVFAEDGRLAERALVEAPSGKVMFRETYDADGTVRLVDDAGKVAAEVKLALADGSEPDLDVQDRAETRKLVVLPMPFRTLDHVLRSRNVSGSAEHIEKLSTDDALAVLAAHVAHHSSEAFRLVARRFFSDGDRRPGFYTLLLAASGHWDLGTNWATPNGKGIRFNPAADAGGDPLVRYVGEQLVFNRNGNREEVAGYDKRPAGTFIQRMGAFRNMVNRFTSGRATQGDQAQRKKHIDEAIQFARTSRDPYVAWATLTLVYSYAGGVENYRAVADMTGRFEKVPGLTYPARYERGRALYQAGDHAAARKVFGDLYRQALDHGMLPPIDSHFRGAFQQGGSEDERNAGQDEWAKLIRTTAELLTERAGGPGLVYLAYQCNQAGDSLLAEEMLGRALALASDWKASATTRPTTAPSTRPTTGPTEAYVEDEPRDERLATTLVAINYLSQTGQHARADELIGPLLEDEEYAKYAELWQLGAALAGQRGMLARSLFRQEQAMELEFAELPDLVNLQVVRGSYGQLLAGYEQLAAAIVALEKDPPRELLAKVIRAADRWRSIDPDDTAACQSAARVLQTLGLKDLAWDYLTTPLAEHSTEAAPWQNLAQALKQQGDFALADRAYATAFEVEPTNAQMLWERAQLLQQTGKVEQARELYRKIADSTWQPRFNGLKNQARNYVR